MRDLSTTHFILKVENGVPTVAGMSDDWTVAVSRQLMLTDDRVEAGVSPAELHYCVRQYGDMDGLVARALDVKVSPKQCEVLMALRQWFTRYPYKSWVRPGRERSWSGPYSGDMVAPARKLEERKLVTIGGVPYGPKQYRLTALGRMVAEHLSKGH